MQTDMAGIPSSQKRKHFASPTPPAAPLPPPLIAAIAPLRPGAPPAVGTQTRAPRTLSAATHAPGISRPDH